VIYRFDDLSLDTGRQELRRCGELVPVEPQVFDLLLYLIRNRDRVVSRDDLIANVWNGRIVADSTLTSRITAVRNAVGDIGGRRRMIRTLSRKGFRFIGEVQEHSDPANGEHNSYPALPEQPSIAVLPFANMSDENDREYFSDGITEDIINALSRLRWFFVIARSTSFAFKGQTGDLRKIGKELGIRYILEGSVRRAGQRVRVSARLVDAVQGNEIWSERYDKDLSDIFDLQDEITNRVVAIIEPKVLAAEGGRAQARPIDDLNAWSGVARALVHFWRLSKDDSGTAISILRETVERHPDYAPAHSLLAFALIVSGHMGWGADRELAARLAQRAVVLDESDAWAYLALGNLSLISLQTDDALNHFRLAIDLNPNFATAFGFAGNALAFDGRTGEALQYFERAMRMSPRDPFNSIFLKGVAVCHYLDGRYDEAVKWARRSVQARPGLTAAHRILCASLAQAGNREEAAAVLRTVRELQPGVSAELLHRSVPYTAGPMRRFLEGMRKAGLE
jgi:TolB-like protein